MQWPSSDFPRFFFARSFQNSRDAIGDALHISERMPAAGRTIRDSVKEELIRFQLQRLNLLKRRSGCGSDNTPQLSSPALISLLKYLEKNIILTPQCSSDQDWTGNRGDKGGAPMELAFPLNDSWHHLPFSRQTSGFFETNCSVILHFDLKLPHPGCII